MKLWKRFLQRLGIWKTRVVRKFEPQKDKLIRRLDPWKVRIVRFLKPLKTWITRGLDYIAPDWDQSLTTKNYRLMMEKLYSDLNTSGTMTPCPQGSGPVGIGIISPIGNTSYISGEKSLTLSPLKWKQEYDSLDMTGLRYLFKNISVS